MMNEEIASRTTRRNSTKELVIARAKAAFDLLDEPIRNEFTRRHLQPEPWGGAVQLFCNQIRDFERLACSGWVENELRYQKLFADFGLRKWKDAAAAIRNRTKEKTSVAKLSDDLRINHHRHVTVRKTGKRVQNYKDVDPTRAIDRYYNKRNWSSDELNVAAGSMLIWPLFQTPESGAELCLESAACLSAANVSDSWRRASLANISERDAVGNEIHNQVHCIAELPRPWRFLHALDLERHWVRWKDAIELSDAFYSVYQDGITQ